MKTITRIGLGLLAAVAALSLVGLLLPRQVHVERSLTMQASPEAVFTQVNTLQNWHSWSPWFSIDPAMQLTFTGPGAGPGASYHWESELSDVGSGIFRITRSEPFRHIEADMDFRENGFATTSYRFEPVAGGTRVVWGMDTDLGYNPAARYMGLLMDHFIGPDFEKGLQNLKKVVEQPATAAR